MGIRSAETGEGWPANRGKKQAKKRAWDPEGRSMRRHNLSSKRRRKEDYLDDLYEDDIQ